MRILLVGEFSSLHFYLKQGLTELGHEVVLASNGDGTKNIPGADCILYKQSNNKLINAYYNYIQPFFSSNKLKGFDVVQFISPRLYSYKIRSRIYNRIIKGNGKAFYAAAGGDYAMKLAYEQGIIDYYMYDQDELYIRQYSVDNSEGLYNIEFEKRLMKTIDGIIPSLFEYSVGYRNNERIKNAIPFPINTDNIGYSDNVINGKIVFFHGITRESNKGTPIIREAFTRLKEKYPEKVDIIIQNRIPFNDYVKTIDKVNVVVDQCKSYGYGINACISMAKGKVVMTGCKKEEFDCLQIDETENPMILTKPDVDFLLGQMEWIVNNSDQILSIGKKSRAYVEKNHDYVKIAQRYIDTWTAS